MVDDRSRDTPGRSGSDGLMSVLGQLATRLKSQPLAFGLAIAVLLVIAASLATETLQALTLPLLAVFTIGLAVWLIVELRRTRQTSKPATALDVDVRARAVGTKGVVSGIEGLPAGKEPPSKIRVDADGVEGRVTGARYRQNRDK